MLLCRQTAPLFFPALMLSRKCTGQFFQVLPRAREDEGCAPGLPPGQLGYGATLGMGGGQGAKLVFRGILAGLAMGVYNAGCLQKYLGTVWPFLSCTPMLYVMKGGVCVCVCV